MGVAIMKRYRSVICFPCGTCTQDISIYRIDIPFIYPSMKPAHDCPCPFSRIWSWKTLRFRMRKKSICTWSILRPWSNSVSSIWLSSFAAIISAFSLRWVPCSSCYIYIYFFSICFIYSCYMYKNAHPVIWYFFLGGCSTFARMQRGRTMLPEILLMWDKAPATKARVIWAAWLRSGASTLHMGPLWQVSCHHHCWTWDHIHIYLYIGS